MLPVSQDRHPEPRLPGTAPWPPFREALGWEGRLVTQHNLLFRNGAGRVTDWLLLVH